MGLFLNVWAKKIIVDKHLKRQTNESNRGYKMSKTKVRRIIRAKNPRAQRRDRKTLRFMYGKRTKKTKK